MLGGASQITSDSIKQENNVEIKQSSPKRARFPTSSDRRKHFESNNTRQPRIANPNLDVNKSNLIF